MKEIIYIVVFTVTTTVNIPCPEQTFIDPITGERTSSDWQPAVACLEEVTDTYSRQMSESDFNNWKKEADNPLNRVSLIFLEKLEICSRDTILNNSRKDNR